jgi:hypothetical protein
MGVWGTGNFDSDYSRDFLVSMVGRWEELVGKLLAGEIPQELAGHEFQPGLDVCEACVISMVEVMIVVAEHLEPDYLPELETVERWRSQYLNLYDRECHIWDTNPEYEAKRRGVIDATFGRLLNIVRRFSIG